MSLSIDLNCDMGESFGPWVMGHDEQVIPWVTSVNIACGFHAGDPGTMRQTVALALKHGVKLGAHPGLPERIACRRAQSRRYTIVGSGGGTTSTATKQATEHARQVPCVAVLYGVDKELRL